MRRLARPLLYAGLVAIVLGLAKVHAAYIGHYLWRTDDPSRAAWTLAYLGLLALTTYASGLPDLPRSTRQALTTSLLATLSAAGAISMVQLVTGDALLPRFVVFGSVVLATPWSMACCAVAQGGRLRAELRDRVVLVAEAAEGVVLRDELEGEPERPAVLVEHLEPAQAAPARDRSRPLVEAVTATGATVVVLDRGALADPRIVSQAAALHEYGLRVRTLSQFYEEWLGKLPVSELERASLFFDIREVHGVRYARIKRAADIGLAALGLLPLAVLTVVVVVANRFGNRGPLVFRQPRVGKNGKVFTIIKFRTMVEAADPRGRWTAVDDPRVTPVGRILRRTHVDELPQVWNVLRGDLSIVGPRPEQPSYVAELVEKLPFYDLRHLVRPGLTGWAQVKYGYAGDEDDALEKLQYEFWYLRKQSLALDLRIVVRTVRSLGAGQGAGR